MRILAVVACTTAACSPVSVEPAAMAKDLPAAVSLDPATRAQATDLGAHALAAATAGDLLAASEAAAAALALDPAQARARAATGLLSMHEAQAESPPTLAPWRRAEGELLQAAALAPDDIEVALALARFYGADGHSRAALDVLDRALAAQPTHAPALRMAGTLAYEASEERRARSYLARLLVVQPDDAETLYRLAQCEAVVADRSGDDAAKAAAWRHVAELFARYRAAAPADAQALLGQAQARFRLWELAGDKAEHGELRAALEFYRAARGLDLERPEPAHGEGAVLESMGDSAGAETAYREALRRRPTHAPSLLNLAALLAERGAADEARSLWERALRAGLTPLERHKVEGLLAGR